MDASPTVLTTTVSAVSVLRYGRRLILMGPWSRERHPMRRQSDDGHHILNLSGYGVRGPTGGPLGEGQSAYRAPSGL